MEHNAAERGQSHQRILAAWKGLQHRLARQYMWEWTQLQFDVPATNTPETSLKDVTDVDFLILDVLQQRSHQNSNTQVVHTYSV